MSVIGSNILAGASGQGGGYNLTKSLRFRSSASANLRRTPASSSNRRTWTWSAWLKRGTLGTRQGIFGEFSSGTLYLTAEFLDGSGVDQIRFFGEDNVTGWGLQTAARFRDPAAWYHIVLVLDTTQATSTNRAAIYVNGVLQTYEGTPGYPVQNFDGQVNTTNPHNIGTELPFGGNYFDGYLAEVNFIDGQALTPSSFGETSATTGVWIPKKYTGSYGTNGFYLDFEDTSSTAALGYDAAGSNDWTVNSISLTAGTTYDSMTDVPTLTSATTANYCVLNPLDKGGTVDPKNGNLGFANTAGTYNIVRSTVGITSGKWYFEYTIVNSVSIVGGSTSAGLVRYDSVLALKYLGQDTNTLGSVSSGTPSLLLYNGTNKALSSGLNSFSVGAVIQYAYDADAGKLWVGVNNSWDGGNDPSTGSTPTLSSGFAGSSGPWFFAANGLSSPDDVAVNFGQQPFAYTPPTDFKALNTFNLPTPTIGATASELANEYFNVVTYTGNGTASARSITGVGFQPDWVWGKGRSVASQHNLFDAVRGSGKRLISNSDSAESLNNSFGYLSSFDADGFSTLAGANNNENWNETSKTYVAWNWKANGAGSSNTAGSISSQVSASTTAGFSIVTYTGNSTVGATIGHGLGVAPQFIIIKSRSNAYNWVVGSKAIDGFSTGKQLYLNTTSSVASGETFFANTQPTSSVFSVKDNFEVNFSGYTYVAYCFAPVAGYSAFGSYAGNSSTDGTFVFLGFRPRFIMIKRSTSADPWIIHDTARDIYNGYSVQLYPNDASAEGGPYSPPILDEVSNGFKLRSSASAVNGSGDYIYMAFAENPFKYANAR